MSRPKAESRAGGDNEECIELTPADLLKDKDFVRAEEIRESLPPEARDWPSDVIEHELMHGGKNLSRENAEKLTDLRRQEVKDQEQLSVVLDCRRGNMPESIRNTFESFREKAKEEINRRIKDNRLEGLPPMPVRLELIQKHLLGEMREAYVRAKMEKPDEPAELRLDPFGEIVHHNLVDCIAVEMASSAAGSKYKEEADEARKKLGLRTPPPLPRTPPPLPGSLQGERPDMDGKVDANVVPEAKKETGRPEKKEGGEPKDEWAKGIEETMGGNADVFRKRALEKMIQYHERIVAAMANNSKPDILKGLKDDFEGFAKKKWTEDSRKEIEKELAVVEERIKKKNEEWKKSRQGKSQQ